MISPKNFENHVAKNEQGPLERKITILRARLEDAEIVTVVIRTWSGSVDGRYGRLEDAGEYEGRDLG